MSDLGSQIRQYIDDVAPALSLDDVQRPAPVADDIPVASPSKARARWLVAAAAVVCIAVIGAGLAMSRDDADQVEAGPATTVPTTGDWSWLTTMGSEVPMPDVPDGWKTLDFEDLRFAVPEDWTVPISRSCAQRSSGWVLVSNGGESESSCSPEEPEPESILTIEPATDSPTEGEPVKIGTLSATRMSAFACSDCPPTYRLDNGFQVTVTGPESDRVLATFTDSGVRRLQQEGPVADSADWSTISFEGLSFVVPAEWGTVDLPGSYSERETGDGMIGMSGHADPGSCGGAMFSTETRPEAYLGSSPFAPRCPPWRDLGLEPADGIWIRSAGDGLEAGSAAAIGTPVAAGQVNGLDVVVVEVDRLRSRTPSAVLDLIVDDGDDSHWISLGVGLDTSVARSVLRSLHASGSPAENEPAGSVPGASEPPVSEFTPPTYLDSCFPPIDMEAVGPDGPLPKENNEWTYTGRSGEAVELQLTFIVHPEIPLERLELSIGTSGVIRTVRSLPDTVPVSPGEHEMAFTWDGRDDSGDQVEPGRYLFYVTSYFGEDAVGCPPAGTMTGENLGVIYIEP